MLCTVWHCWDATLPVRLWDLDTGACERSLTGHTGAISDAAFDSSGLLLASCSSDASIKIWDVGWTSSVKSGAGEDSALASKAGSGVMAARARPASYACVSTLHGHNGPVSAVRESALYSVPLGTATLFRGPSQVHSHLRVYELFDIRDVKFASLCAVQRNTSCLLGLQHNHIIKCLHLQIQPYGSV